MRSYIQHGRRHGPNGSDPIPGIVTGFLGEEEFTTPGSVSSIAGGGSGSLSWDGGLGADSVDLLDFADPTAPAILADGVYAVTVTAKGDSLTVGKFFNLELLGGYCNPIASSGIAAASPAFTCASISFTAFIFGGVDLIATVHSYDTVARDFYIDKAIVLRIM